MKAVHAFFIIWIAAFALGMAGIIHDARDLCGPSAPRQPHHEAGEKAGEGAGLIHINRDSSTVEGNNG